MEAGSGTAADIADRMGRAGLLLGSRRVLIMVVSALATALVARSLGPGDFGIYASALTTATLLQALSDLGFSVVLGRDLATDPEGRPALLRAAVEVHSLWAFTLGGVLAVLALLAGLDTTRGQVLLILVPMVAIYGLTGVRQMFAVLFRVRWLATVDVIVNMVTFAALIGVAVATRSPVAVAVVYVSGTVLNTVIVAHRGLRMVGIRGPQPTVRRAILRTALPLGVASVLATLYFTIDVVVLQWLVDAKELGHYAAAVKFLSLLVALPGLVVGAALPGLSMLASDRRQLGELAGRVGHWLATLVLPVCAASAVFAKPLVDIALGSGFEASIPLVRILALAATFSAVANVLGMVMVALHIVRGQLIGNAIALVLNVGGNVLLAPRFGVEAAAWLTAGTELFVVLVAIGLIGDRMDVRGVLRPLWRPVVATAAFCAVGLTLGAWPVVAIPVSGLVFAAVMTWLRGWPEEFRLRRPGSSLPPQPEPS